MDPADIDVALLQELQSEMTEAKSQINAIQNSLDNFNARFGPIFEVFVRAVPNGQTQPKFDTIGVILNETVQKFIDPFLSRVSETLKNTLFSKLSEENLKIIFDHLPPKELARVNLVCKRWYKVAKNCRHDRHSLSMIFVGEGKFVPHGNHLFYRHFSGDKCEKLICAFPNISHLQIYFTLSSCDIEHNDDFESLANLFRKWSAKLVSLQLESLVMNVSKHAIHFLLDSINLLPFLKKLTIQSFTEIIPDDSVIDLPILSRLEKLRLSLYGNDFSQFFHSLLDYGQQNAALKEIDLFMANDDDETNPILRRLLKLKPEFCLKFVQIPICLTGVELADYVSRFSSLRELHIRLLERDQYVSMASLTQTIASLAQLTYLIININFKIFINKQLKSNNQNLTPLPSVKNLILKVTAISSHTDIVDHLAPVRTYPNLEYLDVSIDSDGCSICDQLDHGKCRSLIKSSLDGFPDRTIVSVW